MKNIFIFIVIIAISSFQVLAKEDSFRLVWDDISAGLEAEDCTAIGSGYDSNNTVYVGSESGLYVKSDIKKNWERIFICRGTYKGINDIKVEESGVIYIATKNGLYKTSNAGISWNRLFKGMAKENNCTKVAILRNNTSVIFLGTSWGLFWSNDGGKKWVKVQEISSRAEVKAIAVPDELGLSPLFVIHSNRLYKINLENNSAENIFTFSTTEENKEQQENHEEFLDEKEDFYTLNDIIWEKDTLYLATNKGLFLSNDLGRTWERLDESGLTSCFINYVLVFDQGENQIFVAAENGVFVYEKLKNKWIALHEGMDSISVRELAINKSSKNILALCRNRIYEAAYEKIYLGNTKPLGAKEILEYFDHEPTINEVQKMAIDYAEVHPDKIKRWRRSAKFKALLPKLSFDIDSTWSDTYEIYTNSSKSYWIYGPQDKTEGWNLSLSWDLSDLVWNESQTSIDVRSKLMVQLRDDIVDEVRRIYFERRRIQAELVLNPPKDIKEELKKTLRLQELTAGLDGLTGNDFSHSIEKSK